jgi:hypothetical protein
MATIQIRHIPDDVYLTYKQRAMRSHQSLQEYLLGKLVHDARQPTLDEILARARENAVESVSTDAILAELDRGRTAR